MHSIVSSRFLFALLLTCVFANAEADAEPEADPQTYTNNAPFSGAIYIVNPNGQEITTANTNMCPSYASISCSNAGAPSWCCTNNYVCVAPANAGGLIGCCPSGSTCGGTINVASITTVTVQVQQQTSVVYVQPQPTVVNAPSQVFNGYCSTLTMKGRGLPTTAQGACGTILIVNGAANLKAIPYGMGAIIILLHLAMGRMFGFFHRSLR
ncbi:hypothetical protein P154DRAFT_78823 [Amniculicola lignicola CBS 123094]|uniref:Carbohydrate-binding module family 19 domain-containing protein n=1 Tax=Amniculicola lignicola CBS 123094 TaxID=1392246 RepID=A0A6A5WS46_9PLEO|nr:hypothetical protein P154DRAFT_78823 [Amniculicola lignicola CBS 123094]